jgi:hypothetical protein
MCFVNMDDIAIGEIADYLDDSIAAADVTEELIAETFALARTGDEAGNVDECDGGRFDGCTMVQLA